MSDKDTPITTTTQTDFAEILGDDWPAPEEPDLIRTSPPALESYQRSLPLDNSRPTQYRAFATHDHANNDQATSVGLRADSPGLNIALEYSEANRDITGTAIATGSSSALLNEAWAKKGRSHVSSLIENQSFELPSTFPGENFGYDASAFLTQTIDLSSTVPPQLASHLPASLTQGATMRDLLTHYGADIANLPDELSAQDVWDRLPSEVNLEGGKVNLIGGMLGIDAGNLPPLPEILISGGAADTLDNYIDVYAKAKARQELETRGVSLSVNRQFIPTEKEILLNDHYPTLSIGGDFTVNRHTLPSSGDDGSYNLQIFAANKEIPSQRFSIDLGNDFLNDARSLNGRPTQADMNALMSNLLGDALPANVNYTYNDDGTVSFQAAANNPSVIAQLIQNNATDIAITPIVTEQIPSIDALAHDAADAVNDSATLQQINGNLQNVTDGTVQVTYDPTNGEIALTTPTIAAQTYKLYDQEQRFASQEVMSGQIGAYISPAHFYNLDGGKVLGISTIAGLEVGELSSAHTGAGLVYGQRDENGFTYNPLTGEGEFGKLAAYVTVTHSYTHTPYLLEGTSINATDLSVGAAWKPSEKTAISAKLTHREADMGGLNPYLLDVAQEDVSSLGSLSADSLADSIARDGKQTASLTITRSF